MSKLNPKNERCLDCLFKTSDSSCEPPTGSCALESPPDTSIVFPRLLAKFESQSEPGVFHSVLQKSDNSIFCTCFGMRAQDHCWHYRSVLELLETNSLPKELPLIVNLKGDQ